MRVGDVMLMVRQRLYDLPRTVEAQVVADGDTTRFVLPDRHFCPQVSILQFNATQPGYVSDYNWPEFTCDVVFRGTKAGRLYIGKRQFPMAPSEEVYVGSGGDNWQDTERLYIIDYIEVPSAPKHTNVLPATYTAYTSPPVTAKVNGADTLCDPEWETGTCVLTSKPASGDIVTFSYYVTRFSVYEVFNAVRSAIADLARNVPVVVGEEFDVESSEDYEHTISGESSVVAVERRDDVSGGWQRVLRWRAYKAGPQKIVRLFSPIPGDYRVLRTSIPMAEWMSDDLQSDLYLPVGCENAICYKACADLLQAQLASRIYTNEFKNAEGGNVARVYEVQNAANNFLTLYSMELRRLAGRSHWWKA